MAKSKAKKKAPARGRAKATKKKTASAKRASKKPTKTKAVKKKAGEGRPRRKPPRKPSRPRRSRLGRRPVPIRAKRAPKAAPVEEIPALVPVPLPEGVRPHAGGRVQRAIGASRQAEAALRRGPHQPLPGHGARILRERRRARAPTVPQGLRGGPRCHPRRTHRALGRYCRQLSPWARSRRARR